MSQALRRTFSLFSSCVLFSFVALAANPSSDSLASSDSKIQTVQINGHDGGLVDAFVVSRTGADFEVTIDGSVVENSWLNTMPHEEFYVTDPDTLAEAGLKSSWRMLYNDQGLYVAAVLEQDPESLVERLSARDQGYLNRDYVSFVLDTSGEARYGYWFQLNLGGSRSDGTIQPERQFSDSWDGAWRGATARTKSGWSAEFFIPWSIVSMPRTSGDRQMGIVFQRKVAYLDERHGYPALPFTKPKYLSAFQKLIFRDVTPRQQLSFFPQVSSTYDSLENDSVSHIGVDMFWRPSTNFQVAATLQPDFGTVEADQVIINLSAIETFFPEKRLFFLEGQEVFVPMERAGSWSYNTPVMLLHTRRIGQRPIFPAIPKGSTFNWDEFRLPADLLGAAKAMGQVGAFRYGVSTAFEDDRTFFGDIDGEPVSVTQSGRDYAVVRSLWESSNGNYKGLGFLSTQMQHPSVTATTHGVDGHFFSRDGKLKIDGQVLMSDIDEEENGYGGFVEFNYAQRQGLTHEVVLETYDDQLNLNHTGYLGRNDADVFKYRFRLRQRDVLGFRESSTRLSIGQSWNGENQVISSGISLSQEFTFQNRHQMRFSLGFDPDEYDDRNSYGNGTFVEESTVDGGIHYRSDSSRRLYASAAAFMRTESIEGHYLRLDSTLVWRPLDRMSMFGSLDYTTRDNWLLHVGGKQFSGFLSEGWSPRVGVDFFLTAKQHLRLDMEWRGIKAWENTHLELPEDDFYLVRTVDPEPDLRNDFGFSVLSLQVRYRWELAPMSDVFFVYSKRASHPNALEESFFDQFSETFGHPTSEGVVVKLRHHLGA